MEKQTAPVRIVPTEEYFSMVRRQLEEDGQRG